MGFEQRKKSGNIFAGSRLVVDGQGIYNVKIIKPGFERQKSPLEYFRPIVFPKPVPAPLCDFTGAIYVTPTPTPSCYTCVSQDITIGTQTWTSCNLNVSTYRNGDPIPEVTDPTEWSNLTTGAWCYYNNDINNGCIYGKLYNWYAVNDPRGLAPIGYHIPSDEEWTILENNLGGASPAGSEMKEYGTSHWNAPNIATNGSGLTFLPGGYQNDYGGFEYINDYGVWWSTTINEGVEPFYRRLFHNSNLSYRNSNAYGYGYSVRCISDLVPTPTPTITPTNTPTPTQTFYYYEATGYECGQCQDVDIYIVKSLTSLTIGYFYNDPLNNSFSYQINQLIAESAVDSDLTGQQGYTDCIQSCYGIYEFRTATSCCNGVTVVMGGIPSSFGSQVLVGSDGGINAIGCYTIGSSPVSGPANILWSGDYGFDCTSCINDWPCIQGLSHGTLFQACNDPGTIDDFCINAPSFCSSTTIQTSNSVTCYGLALAGYYGSYSAIRYWDGTNWTTSCFSGCGCLVANTIITLSDGSTKLVQDIQIDDELKSLDIEGIPQSSDDWYSWSSDTLNYAESTSIVIGFTSFEFDLVININDGRLIATGTHNHVVKQNGMWYIKTTLEIKIGDILLDIDNSEFEITSLVTINEPTTVYNIDVTNSNLYFANNVLTHNK